MCLKVNAYSYMAAQTHMQMPLLKRDLACNTSALIVVICH